VEVEVFPSQLAQLFLRFMVLEEVVVDQIQAHQHLMAVQVAAVGKHKL
jgi:hypothetical protein